MTSFRCFHNTDPPKIAALWQASELGRGAASNFTADALEYFVFSQPYFDRRGLIVAVDGDQLLGFVHALCAVNSDESALGQSAGSIVALLVHPDARSRGIGRALVERAEAYLRDQGAESIRFGPDDETNGFYLGLYGGTQPRGFLESDQSVAGFAERLGLQPVRRFRSYQKSLSAEMRDPVNMKIIGNRRRTQLEGVDAGAGMSWWWTVRFGRMDAVRFHLVEKSTRQSLASCDLFGLDLFIPKWGQRAAGLGPISVSEEHQGNDYDLSLLLEMSRYLRDQLITIIDASVDETDTAGIQLLEAAGFEHCDTGTVWERNAAQP